MRLLPVSRVMSRLLLPAALSSWTRSKRACRLAWRSARRLSSPACGAVMRPVGGAGSGAGGALA